MLSNLQQVVIKPPMFLYLGIICVTIVKVLFSGVLQKLHFLHFACTVGRIMTLKLTPLTWHWNNLKLNINSGTKCGTVPILHEPLSPHWKYMTIWTFFWGVFERILLDIMWEGLYVVLWDKVICLLFNETSILLLIWK